MNNAYKTDNFIHTPNLHWINCEPVRNRRYKELRSFTIYIINKIDVLLNGPVFAKLVDIVLRCAINRLSTWSLMRRLYYVLSSGVSHELSTNYLKLIFTLAPYVLNMQDGAGKPTLCRHLVATLLHGVVFSEVQYGLA